MILIPQNQNVNQRPLRGYGNSGFAHQCNNWKTRRHASNEISLRSRLGKTKPQDWNCFISFGSFSANCCLDLIEIVERGFWISQRLSVTLIRSLFHHRNPTRTCKLHNYLPKPTKHTMFLLWSGCTKRYFGFNGGFFMKWPKYLYIHNEWIISKTKKL